MRVTVKYNGVIFGPILCDENQSLLSLQDKITELTDVPSSLQNALTFKGKNIKKMANQTLGECRLSEGAQLLLVYFWVV